MTMIVIRVVIVNTDEIVTRNKMIRAVIAIMANKAIYIGLHVAPWLKRLCMSGGMLTTRSDGFTSICFTRAASPKTTRGNPALGQNRN